MRILINNPFYYPNMKGGAEQSVKLLAEGLVKRGHEVGIYCVDSQTDKMAIEQYNGVKVYRGTANRFHIYRFSYEKNKVGKLEKIQQKLLTWYNKECVADFEKICRDFNPDLVHSNGTYGMSQFVWKKAAQMGIPVVHTIRDIGIVSPVQYGHKANILLKIFHKVKTSYVTGFVSAVTAPSTYTLNRSLEPGYFKNRKISRVIFNSVDIDRNAMINIIEEKRARNTNKIKFMYAGRLVYFKGIEHMIQAFEDVKNTDMELHICGGGEMRAYVEACAKNDPRMIYHGSLNQDQLAKVYDEADVLLVPSYWPEPFGRVLIEGNIHGLPVIAGDCGGMPEIIETVGGGLLYRAGDREELAKAMLLLSDRNTIKGYYDSIIENIDRYDIRHQISAYEELYRQLL